MAEPATALGKLWGIAEQTWPVRMGKGILSGLTAPRDAWVGEMAPDEVYKRTAELGSLIMGGGMPMTAAKTLGKALPAANNALASRRSELYNPPSKPARPFADDYPSGALADDAGRLLKTIDGDDVSARWVVGRRVVGGKDEAFPPAQYDALSEATIGTRPQAVAGREIGGDAGRLVKTRDRRSGNVEYDILINRGLTGDQAVLVTGHELGHVIDELSGQIKSKNVFDKLSRVYNDLNRQDWRFLKQERTDVPVPRKYRARPEDLKYKGADVPREYWAEAIRAYMADPNYLKSVAPDVAAAIRKYVNSNQAINKTIQFNVGAPDPLTAAIAFGTAQGGDGRQ